MDTGKCGILPPATDGIDGVYNANVVHGASFRVVVKFKAGAVTLRLPWQSVSSWVVQMECQQQPRGLCR